MVFSPSRRRRKFKAIIHKICEKPVEKFWNGEHNLIELHQFIRTAYVLGK